MRRALLVLALVAVFLGVGTTVSMAGDDTLTVRVVAGMGAYLDSNNGTVHIEMPPNASDESFSLRYTPRTPADFPTHPTNSLLLPNPFTLDFFAGSEDLSTLKAPGTMVVKYNPPDLGGRSEATIKLMRLSGDGSAWMEVPARVDITAHTVTAQFSQPDHYALTASNFMPTAIPAPTAVPAPAPAPTAVPAPVPLPAPAPAPVTPPAFRLGFATLAALIPDVVGQPLENEHYGPNGDSLQQTTKGLMVWRKADNWTAFTNGSRTWVNGPYGLQDRSNVVRFDWEAQ